MQKIMPVIGTRPEAIKLVPVIKELERYPKEFELVTVTTAQHRQMLDQVLKLFKITPSYDLDIMENNQTLPGITARIIQKFDPIVRKEKPDCILIQGDTTTAFISALIGFYYKIRIGHIEAGLRTHNKYRPFPEEINRRLTGVLTDFHFAPTQRAKSNLVSEGIQEEAPSLGKPVLVLCQVTERPEALEAGTVRLVGLDKDKIVREAQKLLDNEILYKKMSKAANPYGDGKASKRIVEVLRRVE